MGKKSQVIGYNEQAQKRAKNGERKRIGMKFQA